MKYLVTGAAGFIGSYVSQRLCQQGHVVVGVDNLNDYYDPNLKISRLNQLNKEPNFTFIRMDISDRNNVDAIFKKECFQRVIHLAAQAGVRYSIENPHAYADSNLIGYLNILEGCRLTKIEHLVYASSSSVYGMNSKTPFSTNDGVDHPVSLYAATKRANELMAHTYSHLYDLPTTGLRFFTVYGPWGRPDMALFKFTKAIYEGKPIDIYNNGAMSRDFTYIDDIVEGIIRIQNVTPSKNSDITNTMIPGMSPAPYKIYNIGNGSPVKLMDFITALESSIGITAIKNFMPMQPGDVLTTYADTKDLSMAIDFVPTVSIETGVRKFVSWYNNYYG